MTSAPGHIEVRWSALRPVAADERCGGGAPFTRRSAFVLIVRPVDDHHVLLETWLETPAGQRSVLARQPASCSIERDGDLLHLDVHGNGGRMVAITLESGNPGECEGGRPRYAASPLLAQAGFTPGSYDPPTARVVAAVERDVATA